MHYRALAGACDNISVHNSLHSVESDHIYSGLGFDFMTDTTNRRQTLGRAVRRRGKAVRVVADRDAGLDRQSRFLRIHTLLLKPRSLFSRTIINWAASRRLSIRRARARLRRAIDVHPGPPRDPRRDRAGGAAVAVRSAGGVSDRNGLRAGRRCDKRPRGRRDLCRQGPATLQPADRARPGSDRGRGFGRVRHAGARCGGAVLAGAAIAGVAPTQRQPGCRYWRAPGSTRWRSALRHIPSHRPCCARPAGRLPHPPPTAPGG